MRSLLATLLVLWSGPLFAGQFAVTPIRVEFAPTDKSQAITVSNHGDKPLRIALELKRWQQDASGQESYSAAPDDLIYFPRQFEVAPKQRQVIRVGRKTAASRQERAYRLYINEQPSLHSSEQTGQVAMVISFGVPLFLRPAPPLNQLEISPIKVENKQFHFELSNTGNTTQRLTRLQIGSTGGEIRQFDQWYLHPGVRRAYQIDVPPTACQRDQAQTITLETDQQTLTQSMTIPPSACKP
jgi:fimbrial chaperone protein